MTAHIRLRCYESVGVWSGQVFYKVACSCGHVTLDKPDQGVAEADHRRHAAQQSVAAA